MEENNNNQPITEGLPEMPALPDANEMPGTPEPTAPVFSPVPDLPVAEETPEVPAMSTEAHPVPSLVIEDTSAPAEGVAPAEVAPAAPAEVVPSEAPTTPIEAIPTPEVQPVTVAPVGFETPVAPATPVEPATPATVTPVTPPTGEIPVSDETKASLEAQAAAANGVEAKPAKNKGNLIAIIIIVVCVAISAIVLILRNKDNTPTPTPTPTRKDVDVNSLAINQVAISGVVFTFPETKTTFDKIGWKWDESYAKNTVEAGLTSEGGRIGNAPGGVSVFVYNKAETAQPVENCYVYNAIFSNPKDGSENVSFVGGLGYTANVESTKTRMTELGYTQVNETTNGDSVYLRYFLNNDTANSNDYVEFYFVNNVVETVTISVTM